MSVGVHSNHTERNGVGLRDQHLRQIARSFVPPRAPVARHGIVLEEDPSPVVGLDFHLSSIE